MPSTTIKKTSSSTSLRTSAAVFLLVTTLQPLLLSAFVPVRVGTFTTMSRVSRRASPLGFKPDHSSSLEEGRPPRRRLDTSPTPGNGHKKEKDEDNILDEPLLAVNSSSDAAALAEPRHYYFEGDSVQKQLTLFWNMALPYFKEERSAKILLGVVVALTLAQSGVSVAFSYVGRDFWTALSAKNEAEFYEVLQRFLGTLIVGMPITVMYKNRRQTLALGWREWLTTRVMKLYYSNRNYYSLEASKEVDNPDQRIAEDIRAFTKDSLELFITALTAVIDLAAFSTILFKIYPQLFIAIMAYASIGTAFTTSFGRKLVGLNFLQLQREAFFRYSLMRVRENSESIAFYGGENLELKEISRRLNTLLNNTRDVIRTERNLEFFTVSYRYLIQVIPGLVVAPLFFAGKIELGVVSQSYSAFNHILSDLSLIVNKFEDLSKFSAGIDRLAEFLEKIQQVYRRTHPETGDSPELSLSTILSAPFLKQIEDGQKKAAGVATEEGTELQPLNGSGSEASHALPLQVDIVPGCDLTLENVTVTTPDGRRLLVKDLSLVLGSPEAGRKLLIVGNSGTGKSSLLRVMAGLWSSGKGKITRPSTSEVFFLPQRPYCTLGTLRDQLTYPQKPGTCSVSDRELLRILDLVNLSELPRRVGNGSATMGLDVELDWAGTLSLGEQQRLAFGRLLYNRPKLAILDESTSALDLNSERKMFEVLLDFLPDLSYVSVGHRPSLLEYHDAKLTLKEGGYSLEKISHENHDFRKTAALSHL